MCGRKIRKISVVFLFKPFMPRKYSRGADYLFIMSEMKTHIIPPHQSFLINLSSKETPRN